MTNLGALMALRGLRTQHAAVVRATERLATGKRINRASDDPAGVAVADSIRAERREVEQRVRRYEFEGLSLGAREGALSVVSELLVELEGVVVRAANRDGSSEEERSALQVEADAIVDALRHIADTTTFKGEKLFGGIESFGAWYTDAADPGAGDPRSYAGRMSLRDLTSGGALNLETGDLGAARGLVRAANEGVASARAGIGARLRTIESDLRVLAARDEALAGAGSALEDADFAAEASNLMRAQVLREAGIAALKAALDQSSSGVLALISPRV